MIKTQTVYVEVPVSERFPGKAGWFNLSCNGIPAACGRAYFNGEFFHFTKSSAVSGLLEKGKEIYWHEKKEEQIVMSCEEFRSIAWGLFQHQSEKGLVQDDRDFNKYLSNLIK